MDKGAHFFKTDFQVHTPRDRNWTGEDCITNEERSTYADELILACRQKGLGAIAITDHHDFTFFPYIKDAADRERDENGNPVPAENRIVVYPGLELTLTAPNCQALLLLDADFPQNLFGSILATLCVQTSQDSESKVAEVVRIPQDVVADLSDLCRKLDALPSVKGRFIVLPNVSEGGNGTMLRSGFANFYKNMPCVGGYVDGSIDQWGDGNRSIVAGKNREYGFKSIAVFQTSDNRHRNHTHLGQHVTWVKWSQPTAEAIRQACLAKESRITNAEPELPEFWISSLKVSNSKFMSRITVDFNRQYNAIIGGRGTGKSTILEYLRWGLCDQPLLDDESEMTSIHERRAKLIQDTLAPLDAEVQVTFLRNNITHIVKRNARTGDVQLKIGDGDFQEVAPKQIRALLPIQAYSQKQLSSVGVRLEELKRFVEQPIRQQLDAISLRIADVSGSLRSHYGKVIRKDDVEFEKKKTDLELSSLQKQLVELQSGLKGLTDDDKATITQKSQWDREQTIVDDLEQELTSWRAAISGIDATGEESENDKAPEPTALLNPELIGQITSAYSGKFLELRTQVGKLKDLLKPESLKSIEDAVNTWREKLNLYNERYEQAKVRAASNQRQLDQIRSTEGRIDEIKRATKERESELDKLGDPQQQYKSQIDLWVTLHREKLRIVSEECDKFTRLSGNLIKAEIINGVDVLVLKQALRKALSGMNVREQRIDEVCKSVIESEDIFTGWLAVLWEYELLAKHNPEKLKSFPATPILDKCGFTENEKQRIAEKLDRNTWLNMSLMELDFAPSFQYCTSSTTDEFIPFADASAGQQATALISVLLNQAGAPLIIDQPEDDIDSSAIGQIVERIWQSKQERQLLFASHNANFVVNGDAELVVCCDYVKAGEQTGGVIKATGAIDISEIRREITQVTEGGERAFRLRKEKYGF